MSHSPLYKQHCYKEARYWNDGVNAETIFEAMQEYADEQTAELKAEVERLRSALKTIAHNEAFGAFGTITLKKIAANTLNNSNQ